VGFGGLIFVVIGLTWLGYLVPLFLHRHENGLLEEPLPDEPITPSVTIVRRGVPLDVAQEQIALVSTPLNRRSALRDLDRADARAAVRRRIVLGVLLGVATVLAVLVGVGRAPWWSVAVPGALIAAFLGVARVTVVRMRADLDARAERILSMGRTEKTVAITVLRDTEDAANESVVDLTAPIEAVASLWDPVPITKPTYVSKPLAPRTVRTIDLSAPAVGSGSGLPVTADAPASEPDSGSDGLAVNE